MAAYARAGSVVALDSNPDAVRTARKNAALYRFAGVIDVREFDPFAAIAPGETFDIITLNPPYTPHPTSVPVAASTWDSGFTLHQRFFADVHQFLTPGGRIYFGQASFGPLDRVHDCATRAGSDLRLLGSRHVETPPARTYYAFQLMWRRATTPSGASACRTASYNKMNWDNSGLQKALLGRMGSRVPTPPGSAG